MTKTNSAELFPVSQTFGGIDSSYQLSLPLVFGTEEDRAEWTDEDIRALRESILRDAFTSVSDGRSSEVLRSEIWEWINSDESLPFSFSICAIATGADPDKLRSAFRRVVARLGNEASE